MTRRARAAPTAMGTILLSGISCPHTRGAGEREGGWEGGKVSEDGGRTKIVVGKENRGGGEGAEEKAMEEKRWEEKRVVNRVKVSASQVPLGLAYGATYMHQIYCYLRRRTLATQTAGCAPVRWRCSDWC